jgi:hypothetical protein
MASLIYYIGRLCMLTTLQCFFQLDVIHMQKDAK